MIDYHCHLLPGIDDGSRTLTEALEMARLLARLGYQEVHCTPHCITGLYETAPDEVRSRVTELQQACERGGVGLRLWPGMEYYLDDFFFDRLDTAVPLGQSRLLLFELPSAGDVHRLKEAIFQIRRRGLFPLLAHPERFAALRPAAPAPCRWRLGRRSVAAGDMAHFPLIVKELLAMGCLFQADIGSFSGLYGAEAQRAALAFLKRGYYAFLGSDGHRPEQLQRVFRGIDLPFLHSELKCCQGSVHHY